MFKSLPIIQSERKTHVSALVATGMARVITNPVNEIRHSNGDLQ